MRSKKHILEEKKIPNYLQTIVKKKRRRAPRSETERNQTEAQFSYIGNKYGERILAMSQNGCRITTEAPLQLGDVIKFQSPFVMRGRVVWTYGEIFGIAFID